MANEVLEFLETFMRPRLLDASPPTTLWDDARPQSVPVVLVLDGWCSASENHFSRTLKDKGALPVRAVSYGRMGMTYHASRTFDPFEVLLDRVRVTYSRHLAQSSAAFGIAAYSLGSILSLLAIRELSPGQQSQFWGQLAFFVLVAPPLYGTSKLFAAISADEEWIGDCLAAINDDQTDPEHRVPSGTPDALLALQDPEGIASDARALWHEVEQRIGHRAILVVPNDFFAPWDADSKLGPVQFCEPPAISPIRLGFRATAPADMLRHLLIARDRKTARQVRQLAQSTGFV